MFSFEEQKYFDSNDKIRSHKTKDLNVFWLLQLYNPIYVMMIYQNA
jgi:hypothetical protein